MAETYEEHAHQVVSPITEKVAREKLDELTLFALNQIAKSDGLPENTNRGMQIEGILLAWFSPAEGGGGRELSFQAVLDQAEKLPPGQRRSWRKKTHGKELGF